MCLYRSSKLDGPERFGGVEEEKIEEIYGESDLLLSRKIIQPRREITSAAVDEANIVCSLLATKIPRIYRRRGCLFCWTQRNQIFPRGKYVCQWTLYDIKTVSGPWPEREDGERSSNSLGVHGKEAITSYRDTRTIAEEWHWLFNTEESNYMDDRTKKKSFNHPQYYSQSFMNFLNFWTVIWKTVNITHLSLICD